MGDMRLSRHELWHFNEDVLQILVQQKARKEPSCQNTHSLIEKPEENPILLFKISLKKTCEKRCYFGIHEIFWYVVQYDEVCN